MILETIREKINTGKPGCINGFLSKIEKYQVISFDVFDTLLKRNIKKPKDVFTYINENIKTNYCNYKEERIRAESIARSKKKEVNLYDIYEEYRGINEFDKKYLMEQELNAEKNLLTLNMDVFPIYKKCIELNKLVILITDMYLPESFIRNILSREGVKGYKRLYVSSEVNKTKKKGDLFLQVIDELQIKKHTYVHIGDSFISDYRTPKRLGINVMHIPRNMKKTNFVMKGKDIKKNILGSFINNHISCNKDDYYHFGYEKFGPFLWGYSKWLYNSLINEKIDKVYFFSRDGLIMKKAFDILYEKEKIVTYYLEVSRRSLRVPVLWMNCDFETIVDMISPSRILPLKTIFEGVGLNIYDYNKLLEKYEFNEHTYFERANIARNKKIIQLYSELIEDVKKISKQEFDNLRKYIVQNDLYGKFAVVDIGWSGGMQRYLSEILDKLEIEHNIKGYYIGVAEYYTRNLKVIPDLSLTGYLFDCMHQKNAYDIRRAFVGLFETLFLEQSGSVQNYLILNDGTAVAKRYPYEYMDDEGRLSHECICVGKIQQGAIDFINDVAQNKVLNNFIYTPKELFEGIRKTGLEPSKKDLKLFSEFKFYDEGEIQYLAVPKSVLHYLVHIKELKKDFLLSRWKIGFLKKLLKLNLPYEYLYKILLKSK